ncbi:MAG: SMP-30/gluconolactonase/LRE family protein [Alphaproteobacteria bacterium]|nr:SMP-30/gluconolactonase/LRE family protein [Alphaproteobacteria bacterium]
MDAVRCVLDAGCTLGEGPVWDGREQALYFTDILGKTLNRFDPASSEHKVWALPEHISCFGLRAAGGAVVALRTGIHFFDLEAGALTPWVDPEEADPRTRFSDGKVDRQGRFWAGTMPYTDFSPICSLYRFDPDRSWRKMQDGLIIANGIGWSPDGRTMYHTDSLVWRIYAYDFEAVSGTISNRRVFVEVPKEHGVPDGLTVDAESCVWSAQFDGWRVVRYTPEGAIERTVMMPVQRPTSCMFGGPDLDVLYVTSGGRGASERGEFRQSPHDGGLFAFSPGVRGLPETRFAG